MDQRGGRPRRKRIKAGTIELLCRLKRDVYPDFSLRHFYDDGSYDRDTCSPPLQTSALARFASRFAEAEQRVPGVS
jgi:hypothetical protein